MFFWGVIVIISLVIVILVVGNYIMYWLWGGFSVDNLILNCFYSFYYILLFILVGLSVFYIVVLY